MNKADRSAMSELTRTVFLWQKGDECVVDLRENQLVGGIYGT